MKSNNQYLESINESVSGQMVDERKPNNWYLRSIAKNTCSEEIHGHRTDNYYLKRIALNMEDLDVKELLETIAELRGEVEDLEEQLANDIHLFSCCKDVTQIGESLGLFAYCKHNGELEGNTVYFYAIAPSIISSISITSDKSAISYSDDEKATLTIVSLDEDDNPLPNQQIVIKNGSTTLDTLQTGSDGTVTYEYTSQGAGDVTLTVECGEVSETITIEDCMFYVEDPSQCTNCNISLPSSAYISYEEKLGDDTVGYSGLELTDGSHRYLVGGYTSMGKNGIIIRNEGSYDSLASVTASRIRIRDGWALLETTYDNGDWTYTSNGEYLSLQADYTPTTLYKIVIDRAYMRNIKIKPL